MPYDPTIYAGAAVHYRPGRPPYSPQLEAVLAEELGLDGSGRLLDGGCGPGILTIRLAPMFGETVGLDPDPAMLAEGRRTAEQLDIANIRWVQSLAEDLPAAAPGPYRLVTFGQSFHWTDEEHVAETIYDMLETGGALALIVHTVKGRQEPPSPGPPPIPHDEIKHLVAKYLGSKRRAGQGFAPVRTHRFEDILVRTRFGRPRSIFVPGIPDLVRDSESVLSGYFSMATSAPHLFGDQADEFAAEVRELLQARSPEGVFWDWPGDTEIVLARKQREYDRLVGGCCEPKVYDRMFGAKQARLDAERYRKRGVRGTSRDLVELAGDVSGESVLEVGGGVGAIELELLAAGAERATDVELSGEYEEEAQKLLAERGLSDRVERRVGDFVDEPGEPHDIVVMHRVVCCYPDVDALVGAGAACAQRRMVLTYPRERWYTRAGIGAINVFMRLTGSDFRAFVHPVARISAAAGEKGLALGERRRGGIFWESAAYERTT